MRFLLKNSFVAVALWLLCSAGAYARQPCPQVTAPRIVTATTYQITTADDCGWIILPTAGGAVTIQLPAPGLLFPADFTSTIVAENTAALSFVGLPDQAGVVHQINGLSTGLTVPSGNGVQIRVLQDMNWYVWASGTAIAPTTGYTVYASKAAVTDTGSCNTLATACKTLNYALDQGFKVNTNGGNLILSAGAGTWSEDIFINGPIPGAINRVVVPNIGLTTTWPPHVLILGADNAGSTIIAGTGNFCATIAASYGAVIGVQNIRITAAGSCQSSLFTQLSAIIDVYSGVIFGAATSDDMHAENAGSSIQLWNNYTKSGNATSHMNSSDQASILVSSGIGTFQGNPAFSAGVFVESGLAHIQFNTAGKPFSGAATGKRFTLLANSVLTTDGTFNVNTMAGDKPGILRIGARVNGDLSPCVGGQGGCAVGTAPTGLGGAGAGFSVSTGSGVYSGQIALTAGAAPGNNGSFFISPPAQLLTSNQATLYCTVSPSAAGTGAWAAGTLIQAADATGGPPSIQVFWTNGAPPAALTAGLLYKINYNCNAS